MNDVDKPQREPTIEELKARAYDLLVTIEMSQVRLREVNEMIRQRQVSTQ